MAKVIDLEKWKVANLTKAHECGCQISPIPAKSERTKSKTKDGWQCNLCKAIVE